VFEGLSPSEPWKDVLQKVAEYLTAGVRVVCVLDPEEEKAYVYHADKPEQILTAEQAWSVPDFLPDWSVPVQRFFE
jgi:Uma2 family endonuclease